MQYSPKLKAVMQQVLQILKDNDVAGAIALHTPGFGEYDMQLATSYSAATGQHGRIVVDYTQEGKLPDTANMFYTLGHALGSQVLSVMEAEEAPELQRYRSSMLGPDTTREEQNN